MTGQHHEPRPKFDTLFAEPRHYRGDCRLLRTAIRRGWLADAPQAERDALAERFSRALSERHAADGDNRNFRALMAEANVMIEMMADEQAAEALARRAFWAGKPTGITTGRPRERWHVGDYDERIDARTIQRAMVDAGHAAGAFNVAAVTLTERETGASRTVLLGVTWTAGGVGGPRAWLTCPACGERRGHLYAVRAGPLCRACVGIGYGTSPRVIGLRR